MNGKTFYHALVGACMLLAASPAPADNALYIRALGNVAQLSDSSLDSSNLGEGDVAFDEGFGGGAGIGYDFGRWRLEGEIMYRTNTLDRVSGTVYDDVADGDFSSLGLGIHAFYEFNVFENPKVTSYVGFGAVWFEEIDIDFESSAGELSYSGSDTALQFFLGARYALQNRLAMYTELRQLITKDISLEGEGVAPGQFEADYDRTELVLGISYQF